MAPRVAILTLYFVTALLVSSCLPLESQTASSSWEYADLRSLDPVDADQTSLELIAI